MEVREIDKSTSRAQALAAVVSYDPNGYLQTVTGPVAGATVTYAYDAYGRVRSVTPAGEGVVTTTYDALHRPTRTDFPDGTYEQMVYDKLDVATRRDRTGRLTAFTTNANRQLVATRDPAGRVIQQQYCPCGALDALIDANGNVTRWERDAAGRVLREVRADGVTDTDFTYDGLGRLKTVTDPKQQVTTYTYNLDGSVASVVYSNAPIATPSVSWTYDPAYARVATMIDGTGTTSYTYHPAGQLGAGEVATVDGPLTNDIISYTYRADRLDSVHVSVLIDEGYHHFARRSSSAWAKNAEAFRRISLARFNSTFSRWRRFSSSRSLVVRPGRWPVSRSACRTQRRNDSVRIPSFSPPTESPPIATDARACGRRPSARHAHVPLENACWVVPWVPSSL